MTAHFNRIGRGHRRAKPQEESATRNRPSRASNERPCAVRRTDFALACTLLVIGCSCLGCDDGPHSVQSRGFPPETISVGKSAVELGHTLGTLRKKTEVAGFSITRFPVTVGDYRACMGAGACGRPQRTQNEPNIRSATWSGVPVQRLFQRQSKKKSAVHRPKFRTQDSNLTV
jgi:formylglycine-generating enzyme required for sulfatase activity